MHRCAASSARLAPIIDCTAHLSSSCTHAANVSLRTGDEYRFALNKFKGSTHNANRGVKGRTYDVNNPNNHHVDPKLAAMLRSWDLAFPMLAALRTYKPGDPRPLVGAPAAAQFANYSRAAHARTRAAHAQRGLRSRIMLQLNSPGFIALHCLLDSCAGCVCVRAAGLPSGHHD
jgi:hypothetical protein